MKINKRINSESVELLSQYISELINDIKDNIFFEGVYLLTLKPFNRITLGIIYNDWKFEDILEQSKEKNKRLKDKIDEELNLIFNVESNGYWRYFDKNLRFTRYEDTIEYDLRYGTILLDKNGKITTLKEKLEKNKELRSDGYEKNICIIEPPIKYIKTK